MVSTHPKNISQMGNLPQVGVEIKNIRNHHLALNAPKFEATLHLRGLLATEHDDAHRNFLIECHRVAVRRGAPSGFLEKGCGKNASGIMMTSAVFILKRNLPGFYQMS